jgi:hypothetical protein
VTDQTSCAKYTCRSRCGTSSGLQGGLDPVTSAVSGCDKIIAGHKQGDEGSTRCVNGTDAGIIEDSDVELHTTPLLSDQALFAARCWYLSTAYGTRLAQRVGQLRCQHLFKL